MAAPVITDTPEGSIRQMDNLLLPPIRVHRPGRQEHNGAAGAPILKKLACSTGSLNKLFWFFSLGGGGGGPNQRPGPSRPRRDRFQKIPSVNQTNHLTADDALDAAAKR